MSTASMPPSLPGVVDSHFATAEEIIEALRPRHPLWEGEPARWLYRGHADATWELQPTGVRDPMAFEKVGIALPHSRQGQAASSRRGQLQLDMLRTFRDRLNASGVTLPLRAPAISSLDHGSISTDDIPDAQAYPLMALAQHFGLPTTMLDWTRRGWVAAYFAAADAAALLAAATANAVARATAAAVSGPLPLAITAPSYLAVWALHRRGVEPVDYRYEVILYDAPSYSNPNMHAQSGLVTMSLDEDTRSLERQLATKMVLKRIIAPTSEAPKLLRMLHEEGVDGASMFPGASGVVRAMKETTLWDSLPVALST